MSECQNKGMAVGGCENCTCGSVTEPKPGRVPWLLIALVFMLGFALLFTQIFSRGGAKQGESLFDKTGSAVTETEGQP